MVYWTIISFLCYLSFSCSTVRSSIQPRRSLFLLSCQHLTAVCMHIFSFTYTFSWHMHAHIHRHTCLSHARTHTRSNATVVTGFQCSSFPLAEFPFPPHHVYCIRNFRSGNCRRSGEWDITDNVDQRGKVCFFVRRFHGTLIWWVQSFEVIDNWQNAYLPLLGLPEYISVLPSSDPCWVPANGNLMRKQSGICSLLSL